MRSSRSNFVFVCWLAVLSSAALSSEPDKRPVVPDLVVGSEQSKSFVIEGVLRPNGEDGIGFRVVCDGDKQLTCMYGKVDGVPLLISDGHSMLIYDFGNRRILRHPECYCAGGLMYNEEKESINVNLGFKSKNEADKLKVLGPEFRLNKILECVEKFNMDVAVDGNVTYTNSLDGTVTLKINPQKKDSYQFMFTKGDLKSPLLEIEARFINLPIPGELFAFPDHTKFPKKLKVVDYQPGEGIEGAARYFTDLKYYYAKALIAVGADEDRMKRMLPKESFAELRKRDAKFGKIYRQALADQGIVMPEFPKLAAGKKEAESK